MLNSISIEEIDQLLNELERLSQASSRKKFFDSALQRLKFLIQARGVGIIIRAAADQWVPIAMSGKLQPRYIDGFRLPDTHQAYWVSDDSQFIAVPIRKLSTGESQWHRGAAAVEFEQPPNSSDIEELAKLCDAFAEVLALRQWSELEELVDRKWLGFQKSLANLSNTSSLREAAVLVVNDLAALLHADRVALTRNSSTGTQTLAISGLVKVDAKSQAARTIRKLSQLAMRTVAAQTRHQEHASGPNQQGEAPAAESTSGLLDNYICIPLVASSGKTGTTATTAVLIEWSEYEGFLLGCSTLNYVLPAFAASWLQHQRWLSVPYFLRRCYDVRRPRNITRWVATVARLTFASILAAIVIWACCLPTQLRIEAHGSLQPAEQRVIFAPLDGIVARVLVNDGATINQGDRLLEMRSPMLEIQIQEVQGDLRANTEKRDGLNVAISQLSSETPNAYALQSKFASEIRELETQQETLQQKQQALLAEREKLYIVSPIDGTVIARQIERFLNSRPVRRGDSLLRVVRIEGPWQLELQIADQDAGYVKRKMFEAGFPTSGRVPLTAPRQVEFVIASQPNEKLQARTTWISESARNPQGTEVVVDVLADVDDDVASQGHMGATVYAYFDGGLQPFWFVWSRPLIEAIQRKLWF